MALNITVKEKPGCRYCVVLEGAIDNETYQDLEKRFRAITNEKTKAVCLNMERVHYISSIGISVLVNEKKALQKARAVFVLASLQPMVRKVFDLMRLASILTLVDNEAKADQYINSQVLSAPLQTSGQ